MPSAMCCSSSEVPGILVLGESSVLSTVSTKISDTRTSPSFFRHEESKYKLVLQHLFSNLNEKETGKLWQSWQISTNPLFPQHGNSMSPSCSCTKVPTTVICKGSSMQVGLVFARPWHQHLTFTSWLGRFHWRQFFMLRIAELLFLQK